MKRFRWDLLFDDVLVGIAIVTMPVWFPVATLVVGVANAADRYWIDPNEG